MSFNALGFIDPILRAINELGYTQPTPIQEKSIPFVLSGRDLLASAQTGTGKTASFVLPILQQLSHKPPIKSQFVRALILVPTRELAAQVHQSIIEYSRYLNLRSTVVYGGVKINAQIKQIAQGVDLLVATPGRLLDLHQQRVVKFDEVCTFVLDEADRMLDMGFIHDIQRIIRLLPSQRQNLMFSATFSNEIRTLAKKVLKQPQEVDVAPRNTSSGLVKQHIHPVDKAQKHALLSHLIHKHKWDQALVFARTKHGANKLVKQLAADHIHSVAIHGNKSQAQRTKALTDFKDGNVQVLVATDIAARGLDIEKLPCVVNYDLPNVPEDYVHRIGRTGRAGSTGIAFSLVSADEAAQLHAIEKLINRKLERIEVEEFEPTHHLPTTITATAKPKAAKTYHGRPQQHARGRKNPRQGRR